ncbi:MAG TPA: hypothetical protein VFY67_07385 [Pyrinomonadaceae bacterium]|nr:hypothetical protein [Pyrinomonadaceae bacterium]
MSSELVGNKADTSQIEQRVKELTRREKVDVVEVREVLDNDGKIRGFEVDIR